MSPERLDDLPARELLERMASAEPIPGGGSAAAFAGAMGAAMIRMVVALTTGRPSAAEHEADLDEIAVAAAAAQDELGDLVELDALAYDSVIRARRLPKETELDRQARAAAVAEATREATVAPLQTARVAERVLGLAERLAPIGSRNAISDVGVGALLAAAALRGAALNVRINLPYLDDDDALRADADREVVALLRDLDARERAIRELVEGRLG
jgi:glutamate formiminotransferase/formiminotetrahydrofolate cyclodeaminase